jgi:hypothetical protein
MQTSIGTTCPRKSNSIQNASVFTNFLSGRFERNENVVSTITWGLGDMQEVGGVV